ncbi:tRNA (N(6)-L-threonylcarbamoyladenosine(37)-C(2))-methylthiotransferase MtaB [Aestuariivirga litoralis]|uniref:tRNA (N(6)-L-threonylcarbamoyladenosine(37)-C(2))- methylthiotransferase MtaB n=1 Tax=Aestuariivirga litoralis TaxID=2650924 RepID=UPI0018C7F80C|nr:tRNA (N(6)-L-threonylcarbamoyladenosine(37)-C(2))-methylthiotransferase MtaB [Aestuariivirga litoralis]
MKEAQLHTFGCRLNTFESEIMRGHAEKAGLKDVIIFNTCAVTAEATRQARQAIRKAAKENPGAQIIVTGCAAQTEAETFAAMPEVTRILGNEEKLQASAWLPATNRPRVDVSDIMQVKETRPPVIDRLTGRTRAFVQVQNGCDHRCTFCIIPFGRGNSRSVPIADAVEQVRRLAAEGHNEIVLSGVDLTSWGADLEGAPKLGRLLSTMLRQVPELKRLRLSSIDSIEADEELIEVIAGEARIMPHLHLSLQSGDNMILKRMKRRHNREHTIAFCEDLRSKRSDMVFGADIIAGFPTETDEMFENSLRIVDECALTFLHVFPYSPRPGTPAAKMPPVDREIVKRRAALLRAKGEARLQAFLAAEVGATRDILVETPSIGRTPHFALAKFETAMVPGAVIKAKVVSVSASHLMVGM